MKTKNMTTMIGLLVLVSLTISCKEAELPALTTAVVTNITTNSALSGGTITSAGSEDIVARGVCWSSNKNPTIEDDKTSDGTGVGNFISTITGLKSDETYRLRAYATSIIGTTYGNEEEFTTASSGTPEGDQIIADHTVVDKFDDIPQYYIDKVKKMWLVVAGESHSRGYFNGLTLLQAADPKFAVKTIMFGPASPDPYTTEKLRASRATWGDVDNASGWIYSYGEEDWWTTPLAISRTKAGITYCNTHNLEIAAIGFGWCYDDGVNYTDYCNATKEYIDYCKSNGYNTRVFYTTSTCDMAYGSPGAKQYNRWLGAELIRDFVSKDETRILFDYYDILCYDDDGSGPRTAIYNGNTYNVITDTNDQNDSDYHISPTGAQRVGKAMWWMLARMAGWDGN